MMEASVSRYCIGADRVKKARLHFISRLTDLSERFCRGRSVEEVVYSHLPAHLLQGFGCGATLAFALGIPRVLKVQILLDQRLNGLQLSCRQMLQILALRVA